MDNKIPQGADLEGKLCGVSIYSLEDAQYCAENVHDIKYINLYDGMYESHNQEWNYAYPVSDERIEQMKAGL